MSRRTASLLVLAAAIAPRLAVLLYERGRIVSAFTEKSDDFARTFVESGTFGFIPGVPSAYTQPLYGFFLVPVHWIFGGSWVALGLIQIAVAAGTALIVYEIARRWLSPRAGLAAALVAALNPYLVWHDVHVNRELLDTLLAAAIVLLALLAAERRSLRLAAALGLALGLGVLGNSRLVLLPVLTGAFLLVTWSSARRALPAAALSVAVAALAVAPWVVRNGLSVGCYTLTTDARALWKANNANTYATLAHGGRWIDDVPPLPGTPPTPELVGDVYKQTGKVIPVDECAQMRFYRSKVLDFWGDHPGEKGRLAAQAAGMLWQPVAVETAGGPGSGWLRTARRWVEPVYLVPLYALALAGALAVRRRLAGLAVALLAYQTLAAMVFAGATRYRAPWDFLVVLLAAGGAAAILERLAAARGARRPGLLPRG